MKNDRTRFEKKFQFFEAQASSPLSAQILEFCDSELFQETIPDSEAASSSNYCYEEHSSYFPPDNTKCPNLQVDTAIVPHFTDHQYPYNDQDQFDISVLQNQIYPTRYNNTDNNSIFSWARALSNDDIVPINDSTTLPSFCNEDSINPLSPNYPLVDPSTTSYFPLSTTCFGIFDNDPRPHSYNSNDLQTLSNESKQLVNGCGSYTNSSVSEVTSLGSESFKVTNKLTSAQRKEKIHKYLKKRNERNFNKKIKYACRKTLADRRPRVRGRFAKNDEFWDNNRTNSNNEEDADEDQGVVKEEEVFGSLDIFSHINGVNSFKFNYPVQSWI